MPDHPTSSDAARPAPSWEEIAQYVAGELSPERTASVALWLDAHTSDGEVVARLGSLVADFASGRAREFEEDIDAEGALRRVKSKGNRPGLRVVPGTASPRTPKASLRPTMTSARRAMLWAAAVLLVAFGANAIFGRTRHETSATVAEYSTGTGEVRSVILPDSSGVLLGPSSRLVADSSFGQASRSVALVGEARFTVRHDARRPFVVRSGGARVEDLGTVFLVRESTEGVRVAVTEGRVRLQRGESGAEAVDLDAGDAGTMSATGIVKYPRGAVEGDTTWASRRLVYVDAPLADVARDLQRWTGIQLAIDSAVAAKRFSGSVGTSSGAEAVSVLALTLGAQVSWRGDTATLVRARR